MANSAYYANKVLDATFKNTTYAVAVPYISLHTADPGTTGASEVAGGSYARQSGAFASASAKASVSNAAINYTLMPACTATHFGVWDASSGGNFLWGGVLSASKTINAGDTFQFPSGQLAFSIST